ncbi:fimbrial protein YehD [Citrobacter freundii]|uniref:fimbrial protein YehD n=1 Tax=Citrobacter freundii TaxID=546 RepID=UPI00177BE076|nr:fimbrial protein YehD [Citrobacter freundii]HBC9557859.1 fimbrial protein YehD [Escherichia coli]MBD9990917.1 fimbrial protein YehD [Citrobacter freundii]MBE0055678.1 fimbrial protein YehD [Citrobacter freundii]MDT7289684.1 fimbrial protein YehD [Citrobacter freundii]HBU6166046.1 fimbrial protein YehD [Citrobacter freundii]
MKRSIISAVVLSAVFMSAGASAADSDSGILNINGTVTGTSCQFVNGATEATITLSSIPESLFSGVNVGSDVTYGEGRASTPLEIKCTNSDNVKIFISGNDVDNNDVIIPTTGVNTGVGFKLFHNNKSIAKSGSVGIPLSEFPAAGDGVYKLDLAARYAKRMTDVTPGDVNATVTLKVVQE